MLVKSMFTLPVDNFVFSRNPRGC